VSKSDSEDSDEEAGNAGAENVAAKPAAVGVTDDLTI